MAWVARVGAARLVSASLQVVGTEQRRVESAQVPPADSLLPGHPHLHVPFDQDRGIVSGSQKKIRPDSRTKVKAWAQIRVRDERLALLRELRAGLERLRVDLRRGEERVAREHPAHALVNLLPQPLP